MTKDELTIERVLRKWADANDTECINELSSAEVARIIAADLAASSTRALTPKQKAAEESGAALIAAERQRQIESEGWTPEHDDAHGAGEMADAARAYIISGLRAERDTPQVHLPPPPPWPWDKCWWRPSTDPIRNLVKAGALIAAEIDRLQRAAKAGQTKPVDLK